MNKQSSLLRLVLGLAATAPLWLSGAGCSCRESKPAVQTKGTRIEHDVDALPEGAESRLGSTRFLPRGEVWAVALSPASKVVATGTIPGSVVNEVELWDAESGRKIGYFAEYSDNIIGLAWSPNGERLAVSRDHRVEIWDPEKIELAGILEAPKDALDSSYYSLRWSQDQRYLAAFQFRHSEGSHAYVWDANDYHLIASWAYKYELLGMDIAPDGEWVAMCGKQFFEIQNLKTQLPRFSRTAFRFSITSIAFSPDGLSLAGATEADPGDCRIMLFDAQTGDDSAILDRFPGHNAEVIFTRDGKTLASSGGDGAARLWDVASRSLRATLIAPGCIGRYCSFSRDGSTLVTADRRCQLWDVVTGEPRADIVMQYRWAKSVAFTPNETLVSLGSGDQTVQSWRLVDGKRLSRVEFPVQGLAISPDGKKVASAEAKGELSLRDARTGEKIADLPVPWRISNTSVGRAVFSSTVKELASVHADDTLRIWDIDAGKLITSITVRLPNKNPVTDILHLAFSPDGRILGWSCPGQAVELWDLERNESLGEIPGSATEMGASFAFSPDGNSILVPKPEKPPQPPIPDMGIVAYEQSFGAVRLWDFRRKEEIWSSERFARLQCVKISPNGRLAALFFSSDERDRKTIQIWDAQTGKPLGALSGHTDGIHELYFSPDSSQLISASYDTTMLVWKMEKFR